MKLEILFLLPLVMLLPVDVFGDVFILQHTTLEDCIEFYSQGNLSESEILTQCTEGTNLSGEPLICEYPFVANEIGVCVNPCSVDFDSVQKQEVCTGIFFMNQPFTELSESQKLVIFIAILLVIITIVIMVKKR